MATQLVMKKVERTSNNMVLKFMI